MLTTCQFAFFSRHVQLLENLYTHTTRKEMMPSTLPFPSSTLPLIQKSHFLAVSSTTFSKSHICFAFSPSNQNPSGEEARWQREEQRWLREEQRWLREEQRWLREESRWNAERLALLQEISSLKLEIQELERLNSLQGVSVSENNAKITKLQQVIEEGELRKYVNRISDSGSSSVPFVVEAVKIAEEEEVVVKEVLSIPDKKNTVIKRVTLRKGSEGDDVRAMQEALQKLGFYSGEEDMEFSSLSSGTERAVKTWQASMNALEDGIMTADLLERLFGSSGSSVATGQENKSTDTEKSVNGAPIASVAEASQVQKITVTEEGVTEFEASHHRVFLLGENRFEEPSRLSGGSKSTTGKGTTRCPSCRGEGRLLCMECDGSGEPNVEPQVREPLDNLFTPQPKMT